MTDEERSRKGQEVLRQLRGGADAQAPRPILEEVFPDLWQMTVEHVFGEVWARPGLPLRDRSLITMAVLTALERTQELRLHMGYAHNLGISREEILELAMHVAHYAGWPVAVNACRVAKDVFSPRE